jgi:dTDP-3-amino-2,3,6-trideoxy-4-keto-D-glucose/dTDP-3-amino-3,4,6-trideoxy-alpha-D-glucose/dTDP-2,6-dideoxy-D-kanosamine transaminase
VRSDDPVVPFNDLGRGTRAIRREIDAAVARVLDSGWYVMGPEHNALEGELSEYLGTGDTVLVGNGTDALQLALSALDVGEGHTVLTAANAGGYTSTAVRSIGATPVFADVEPEQLLLSVDTVSAAIDGLDSAPAAIVVTHLFGAIGEIEAIVEFAHARGIPVVEDCAQSIGATLGGRKGGNFGDIATTSFYPTKNLGALGDGGAVMTSRPELAQKLRQLRQYGWESKYRATVSGGRNSRLDEMQAAILRVKLPRLDALTARRREIHAAYEAAAGPGVRLVNSVAESFVGHLAVADLDDREAVRAELDARGIRTDVHYPIPDHLQPLMHGAGGWNLPVTERSAERILSLPLFPELTDDEVARVVDALGRLS